jgi:hypothetical protein
MNTELCFELVIVAIEVAGNLLDHLLHFRSSLCASPFSGKSATGLTVTPFCFLLPLFLTCNLPVFFPIVSKPIFHRVGGGPQESTGARRRESRQALRIEGTPN